MTTNINSKGWIKIRNHGTETIKGLEYMINYSKIEIVILRIVKFIQKSLWKLGVAIHDPVFGECTPDFNCCSSAGRKKLFKIKDFQ